MVETKRLDTPEYRACVPNGASLAPCSHVGGGGGFSSFLRFSLKRSLDQHVAGTPFEPSFAPPPGSGLRPGSVEGRFQTFRRSKGSFPSNTNGEKNVHNPGRFVLPASRHLHGLWGFPFGCGRTHGTLLRCQSFYTSDPITRSPS